MQPPFLTSAPAKVILFGEHSAVYGKHAIAASIHSLRTYLYVTSTADNAITLNFPDIKLYHTWESSSLSKIPSPSASIKIDDTIDQQVAEQIQNLIRESNIVDPLHTNAAFCFLYLYKCLIPNTSSLKFTMVSTSPIGAGLGSSAAVSVALSYAMLQLANQQTNKKLINKWAFVGEKCIHGNPSGVDNLVSTHGGAILYKKGTEAKLLDLSNNPLEILLTYTKVPRSTKTLVSNVRQLYEIYPDIITPVLDSMDSIACKASHILTQNEPDFQPIASLVDINQGLLQSLGVSHEAIAKICLLSEQLHIGPTKLTGAGGGGCTLTLIQDSTNLQKFKETLTNTYGFDTIETQLGGDGCLLVSNDDLNGGVIKQLDKLFEESKSNKVDRDIIDSLLLPGPNQKLPWK